MRVRGTRQKADGFALVAALLVALVLAILIMAVLTMAMSARLLSSSRQEYTQAINLAEAGINAVISEWRSRGAENPPPQPYEGELANGSSAGAYSVTWDAPDASGVVSLVSRGITNAGLPGTAYHVRRAVQVDLDTDGDWAWNHVYYSDSDQPGMDPPLYADISGGAGEVEIDGIVGEPEDFTDHPNGPAGGQMLPSPMWDMWHDWVQYDLSCDPFTHEQIPRDPDGDGVPDPRWPDQATLPACTNKSVDADADRHMYWYGDSESTPLDPAGHSADGHAGADENWYMPDWYGYDNPDAYVCNSDNSRFTVTFGSGTYTGNYYVHGDIHVKNRATINGTLIATGNIRFYGVEQVTVVPDMANPDAPCDERVYYPAIIAGGDVLVRDQGATPGDDNPDRLRVSGVIWAGGSYTGQASNVEGCVVSPSVNYGGNWLQRYGITNLDGCDYYPGQNPPPWFREPDRGEMQPVVNSWLELGLNR